MDVGAQPSLGRCPPAIAYGFENATLPVYFNQDPVINASGGGIPPEFAAFFGGGGSAVGQNTTPMANSPNRIASLEPEPPRAPRPQA